MPGRPLLGGRVHELVFQAAPDGLLVVDAKGRVVLSNVRASAILGGPSRELDGCAAELLVPRLPDAGVGEVERTVRRLDGAEQGVHVRRTDLPGGACLLTLREAAPGERDDLRRRGQLLATVSHELRTPLTSIVGYSELLAELGDDELSPEARRLVSIVRRHVDRELQLVDDLLTLAHLDGPLMPPERLPVDLAGLARPLVRGAADEIDGVVSVTLEATSVPRVAGDVHGLSQVLQVLLSNALKFTPPGGSVVVRVRQERHEVVLEVEDDGIGIADHEQPHVFEALFRGAEAVRRQIQGAGLGLAIANAVVEGLDGTLEVESELGSGSVFRVRLPAMPADTTSVIAVPTQR
ncbi:hypothetical protein DDE18_08675 [Nocardioides gansuensis]|uniref:histidine kinase n=1 Tax=Nocardioides gansuensis TaxID=2138300 RepID=A0A2T8FCC1_9ACTN|nr:ATP-binding protein [Nocardioides gansuensis]PVG83357.1 hypothetical protein DDE18_08675 [Nocardioides gansuensis]